MTEDQRVASPDPIYQVEPKHVWLRITNMEKPGHFQVILEVTDANGEQHDRVIYESINEHDGMIGHHHNLTWLVTT